MSSSQDKLLQLLGEYHQINTPKWREIITFLMVHELEIYLSNQYEQAAQSVGDAELMQLRAEAEQMRAQQAEQAEALQTLMEKLALGTELLGSILDEDPPEQKPTPEDVIKKYYRRHAKNPKITLKQVCDEMGVNYASIRVAKVAYDKQRRRGHKD